MVIDSVRGRRLIHCAPMRMSTELVTAFFLALSLDGSQRVLKELSHGQDGKSAATIHIAASRTPTLETMS